MAIYDYALAGNDTLGTYAPNQLISGESDIVTGPGLIAAGQVLDKYTVMARNVAGALVPLDTTQTDGRQLAVCILMTAINTTAAPATTTLGVSLPVGSGAVDTLDETYTGGVFNPDMLVWPAAVSTLPARIRQFDRTNIRLQRPL